MSSDIKAAGWNFDNSYAKLPKLFYTNQNPTTVKAPMLVMLNEPLAAFLGLDATYLKKADNVSVFAGNLLPDDSVPLAQAYAGHQFGYFTMLGDGRALLLGEQITPKGERFDIQLKGSGKTPYSRRGDGRATLGPMLREYVISEAMHALKIPTTRSLAVVTTGENIYRETALPGAVLTRAAASHIRVGTFEYASKWGTIEDLSALSDYAIKRHYPDIDDENLYISFLEAVVKRQAALVAKWQLVGFIHGVMNTDNVTISGETIDYGPCAFMDAYDPDTVFSSIDYESRYAYGNQPQIMIWNLMRFAETLLPLIHSNREQAVEMAQQAVLNFAQLYNKYWLDGMRSKLGLFNEEPEDEALFECLLSLMYKHNADYTNTFRALTLEKPEVPDLFRSADYYQWNEQWQARLTRQPQPKASAFELMRNSNPAVIPRNHRVEEAFEAANNGDFSVMERLLQVVKSPFSYTLEQTEYSALPPASDIPYCTYCGT